MKDQKFIAKDGKTFTSEKDCQMYDNFQKIAGHADAEYSVATWRMQLMKCRAWLHPEDIQPTMNNISECHTLPRIEEICKLARLNYLEALNRKGHVDHPKRVTEIVNAAMMYDMALKKRKELFAEFNGLKKQAKESHPIVYARRLMATKIPNE